MDIYDLLNQIIVNKSYELSAHLFTKTDREKLDGNNQLIFDLLKNISSLGTKVHNSGIEFHPMFVKADGQRTFSVDDITEDQYLLLSNLYFERIPLILRALIADILWVYKKNHKCSGIAAEAYWELFNLWYLNEDYLGTLDMIKRALCITVQTKNTELMNKIILWRDSFVNDKASMIDGFFSLRIIKLFAEQKDCEVTPFLPVLDSIILLNEDNVIKVEQAYELKTYCLNKLKRMQEVMQNNLLLANYYVDYAEKTVQQNIQGAMQAVMFFQKGIALYRNNGQPQTAKITHKRLVEVQKEIPKTMIPLVFETDMKEIVENINKYLDGLSFEESVIRLTQMIAFEKQEDIKKRVLEEHKSNPTSHMFGKNIINAQGQTILALPPLDFRDPNKDMSLLDLHMHQNALNYQSIIGDRWIKNTLSVIKNRFSIEKTMLDFLVKDNPIIPAAREGIIQSGLCMFLRGDFYEAMHILAPQAENLFRNIAREAGGLTVTLENDGSSMEKTLSSIFTLPEILDCYDNDILFIFKGLLNEQSGANIRNKVAHGIISEKVCSSGACLYFGVAFIKLLSYTSEQSYVLLMNSEKLKFF